MANHLRSELVLDALEMAITRHRPRNEIHHSDRGSQDTSLAFGSRCQEAGGRRSKSSVGDAYDDAMAERFFSTLESALFARRFRSQAKALMACFSDIEGFYNPPAGTRRSYTAQPSSTSRRPNRTRHRRSCSAKPPEPSTETRQSQSERLRLRVPGLNYRSGPSGCGWRCRRGSAANPACPPRPRGAGPRRAGTPAGTGRNRGTRRNHSNRRAGPT